MERHAHVLRDRAVERVELRRVQRGTRDGDERAAAGLRGAALPSRGEARARDRPKPDAHDARERGHGDPAAASPTRPRKGSDRHLVDCARRGRDLREGGAADHASSVFSKLTERASSAYRPYPGMHR